MKNILQKKFEKKISLGKKKLINNPVKIFKKITSFSLKEKYKNFKEKIKQKELERIELSKKEKIKELQREELNQEKQRKEEVRLIQQKELEFMLNKQGLLGYYKYQQFRDEFHNNQKQAAKKRKVQQAKLNSNINDGLKAMGIVIIIMAACFGVAYYVGTY